MNIIKMPGGKAYHCKKIVPLMRATRVYCEPFLGGGSVFFWKMFHRPSPVNLLSDLDSDVINFWKVLRAHPMELTKALMAVPYELGAFLAWRDNAITNGNQLVDAMRFFILHRMSRSGLCKDFSDSSRQRRGMDEGVSAYETGVSRIGVAANMLNWASLDTCPALATMELVSGEVDSLTYLDPPYVPSTRVTSKMYKHEMTLEEHGTLLEAANKMKGKVIISGYDHPLYRGLLSKWTLTKLETVNRMSQGEVLAPRTECLWRNYW